MDNHSCWLVDHHKVCVFIYYVEGYVFRFDGSLESRPVEHQCYDVTRSHLVVALHRFVVYMHISRVGSLLDTVARRVLQFLAHELIHPCGYLSRIHLKAEVLIELLLSLVDVLVYIFIYVIFCHYENCCLMFIPAW